MVLNYKSYTMEGNNFAGYETTRASPASRLCLGGVPTTATLDGRQIPWEFIRIQSFSWNYQTKEEAPISYAMGISERPRP